MNEPKEESKPLKVRIQNPLKKKSFILIEGVISPYLDVPVLGYGSAKYLVIPIDETNGIGVLLNPNTFDRKEG